MPELPEVECVRLSLERLVVGRLIRSVRVNRIDVIRGETSDTALLVGNKVSRVIRHGKQLAIISEQGGCVSIHLGMSGQLCVIQPQQPAAPLKQRTSSSPSSLEPTNLPPHTHVLWQLDDGPAIRFTDPRRFGGLWTFPSTQALINQRWSRLGPDALSVTPSKLYAGLSATQRCLKAALLDQHVVAGLGNIYVDELLFNARLHPQQPASSTDRSQAASLARRMKTLLLGAIERGGSSLRDYVDAENNRGSQQDRHRVYGRTGQRCKRRGCPGTIRSEQVAGRTTAWCPNCQKNDGGL